MKSGCHESSLPLMSKAVFASLNGPFRISPMPITRPASDEYAAYYATYVDKVTEPDVVARLITQQQDTARLLAGLNEQQAAYRYAAGKWSLREIIGHLSDAERIFGYRLLRIARGDATPLPGFEENDYVAAAQFERRSLADVAAARGAECRGPGAAGNRQREAGECPGARLHHRGARGPPSWGYPRALLEIGGKGGKAGKVE
jgi:hypothetical protein